MSAYEQLLERFRDISRLGASLALLDWDQETYMPSGGVEGRAEQIALLSALMHEKLTSDETGALLERAEPGRSDAFGETNVREARRQYEREKKLPTDLVRRTAQASAVAKSAWAKARGKDDFAEFAPHLSTLIELKREAADLIGFEGERYDALMDEFEPGMTAAAIAPVFAELRTFTSDFLKSLEDAPRSPDDSILTRVYPIDVQARVSRRLAAALNFDFERGRCDESAHPFCTSIGGPGDVRITTRYLERFLSSSMFGTMHEVGHALYEQGLPREALFAPAGEAVSLGIHESQSRLWENLVGRSLAFWNHHYAALQQDFPEALGDVSLDAFYGAINAVKPSLIRVEADEVTYNLHIVLRFELERELLEGKLAVNDLPERWNESMREMLGVVPDCNANGCLQDIHWSMGAFGYFPTYALGNLYACQLFDAARAALGDLDEQISRGETQPLLNWLRENVHAHGKRYEAAELVERVTGKPLSMAPFATYVREKFGAVYGV